MWQLERAPTLTIAIAIRVILFNDIVVSFDDGLT
jgi:hypothetical protein